jgi:hypothetical protein
MAAGLVKLMPGRTGHFPASHSSTAPPPSHITQRTGVKLNSSDMPSKDSRA